VNNLIGTLSTENLGHKKPPPEKKKKTTISMLLKIDVILKHKAKANMNLNICRSQGIGKEGS
jgi:hypothetical protein